ALEYATRLFRYRLIEELPLNNQSGERVHDLLMNPIVAVPSMLSPPLW
ncbi:hypothetical protein Tco_0074504, partial [Tanacetum coccineum]